MTPSTLHPEELLDRARAGTLAPDERELLAAHLRACAACAMECRNDFDGELEPAANDDALFDRAIEGALATPEPRRIRWRTVLFAAAMLLLAALAVAGALRSRERKLVVLPPVVPAETNAVETPRPVEQPIATAEASTDSIPIAPAPSAARAPTAAELFARATQARRDKNDTEAIRLYRELQSRYPDSREAGASRVVLGQLLLDRTDPEKALTEFDGYLKDPKKGAVTEEALVGRALALEKLGRRDQEKAAWRELLAKYPGSVHAARARERLGAP